MKKNSTYMDRAMQHRDPRFARILGKLGYTTTDMAKAETKPEPKLEPVEDTAADLTAMRSAYKEASGKFAHHTWDIAAIKAKLEAMDPPADDGDDDEIEEDVS